MAWAWGAWFMESLAVYSVQQSQYSRCTAVWLQQLGATSDCKLPEPGAKMKGRRAGETNILLGEGGLGLVRVNTYRYT